MVAVQSADHFMSQTQPTSSLMLHGRYRIDAKLGTGRLATVYRGYDERLQRLVLVHMLRQELGGNAQLRQRFVEESHASARRSHQSLLEVFDSGEVGQRPYMVTEYVAGRTLRELGVLSLEEALLYFRQVVGAVATCQAAGVPHPPISSNNLVLVEDGHVELLENWSTPLDEVAADLACYRAPERTEGKPATHASAVYSLGLLLYEMLTGRRMISGDDAQQIAQAHLTAHIPPLSQARPLLHVPALEHILLRATARRPEDRQPDAAALARELDEMRRNLSSDTRKLDRPPVEALSLRRRINRRASTLVTPRPPTQPAPLPVQPSVQPTVEQPVEEAPRRMPRRFQQRSFGGIITLVVLFFVVGFAAYSFTSFAVDKLLNVQLPRPSVQVPNIGQIISLPEWLTGVVGGSGDIMVVDGAVGGLNVRSGPSLSADVIAVLPNGTRVRKEEGPQPADGVNWIHIRTRLNDQTVDGWLSEKYVKLESGTTPNNAP